MPRFERIAVLFLLASAPSQAAETQRGCVVVQATARYLGSGYNHVASAKNQCPRAVECELWSDVDPEPHHVIRLEPQASADTVFRIGSPAYAFRAFYRCRYRLATRWCRSAADNGISTARALPVAGGAQEDLGGLGGLGDFLDPTEVDRAARGVVTKRDCDLRVSSCKAARQRARKAGPRSHPTRAAPHPS
jgi:hypothetical protein